MVNILLISWLMMMVIIWLMMVNILLTYGYYTVNFMVNDDGYMVNDG